MSILNNIYNAVFSPLKVVNRKPIEGRLMASIIIVSAAAFTGSILAPLVFYFTNRTKYEISLSFGSMLMMLLAGVMTWLAVCLLFWLLSVMFKKQAGFLEIASTWGFSYVPNLLCILAYSALQSWSGFYIGSGIAGFLINSFFIMLLVWKAIFFFMEMKLVIGTNGLELLISTLASGIIFVLLMAAGASIGIQVPML